MTDLGRVTDSLDTPPSGGMDSTDCVPYLGRMTLITETERVLTFGIRDRLRLAREEAYPGMDKADFSQQILHAGKNIATAYESKSGTGTREENMKDLILAAWARECHVSLYWLKYGEPSPVSDLNRRPPLYIVAGLTDTAWPAELPKIKAA